MNNKCILKYKYAGIVDRAARDHVWVLSLLREGHTPASIHWFQDMANEEVQHKPMSWQEREKFKQSQKPRTNTRGGSNTPRLSQMPELQQDQYQRPTRDPNFYKTVANHPDLQDYEGITRDPQTGQFDYPTVSLRSSGSASSTEGYTRISHNERVDPYGETWWYDKRWGWFNRTKWLREVKPRRG